jgi:hypothetical protein
MTDDGRRTDMEGGGLTPADEAAAFSRRRGVPAAGPVAPPRDGDGPATTPVHAEPGLGEGGSAPAEGAAPPADDGAADRPALPDDAGRVRDGPAAAEPMPRAPTGDLSASARAIEAALFGEDEQDGGDPTQTAAVSVPVPAAAPLPAPAAPPKANRSLTALALERIMAEAAERQRPPELGRRRAAASDSAGPSEPLALPPPDDSAGPSGEGTQAPGSATAPAGGAAALETAEATHAGEVAGPLAEVAAPTGVAVQALPVPVPDAVPVVAADAGRRRGLAEALALNLWPAPAHLAWALPLVLVALLVGRLLVAPLTVPVAGLVAAELGERMGVPVTVDEVRLRLGMATVEVRVEGVKLETAGATALLGEVRLVQGFGGRTVELHEPEIEMRPAGGPPPALPAPEAAVAALDRALSMLSTEAARGSLNEVAVTNGKLTIIPPAPPAAQRTFDAIDGMLNLAPGRIEAHMSLLGAGGLVTARLERTADAAGTRIGAAAEGLVPADLGHTPAIREGFRLAPVFDATIAPDGTVTGGILAVGIGRGTVVFGIDPPRMLDEGHLQLALGEGGLVVENTSFVAGGSRVDIAGTLTPGAAPTEPWTFRLHAPVALFAAPDVATAPVDITLLEAEGTIDLPAEHVRIASLRAANSTGRLDAALDFDFTGGPHISGAAHIGPSVIATLLGAWPPVIAYDPRMAVMNTVLGGVVTSLDLELALTPIALDGNPDTNDAVERAVVLDTAFVDTTLTVPELPVAIQRARGELKMLDRVLSVRIDGGLIPAGEAGELTVTEGYLTIQPLGARPPTAEITATVRGPLSAVVALADRLNLPQLKAYGLAPADVTGAVEATLAMSTPLGDDVPMEDREWSIDARLTNAGSTKPIGEQTITNADIELLINPRRLAAHGGATIDGIRIDVNYSELFAGEKTGGARFVLTDRDRRQKGFDTGDAVRGPVVVTVDAAAGEGTEGRAFTADLTEAEVTVPGLSKAAGDKLVAEGSFLGEGSDITVQNLRVEGAGVSLGGTVSIDAKGLTAATLDPFGLSRGDKARVAVERSGAGYKIYLNAETFDARRLVAGALNPAGPKEKAAARTLPPLTVSATGERVILRDGAVLANVDLEAKRGKERMESLSFTGFIDGTPSGSVAVRLAPEGGERRLQGDIAELGRVLSALGVYDRMRRGRTTLDAKIDDAGVMRGRLVVDNFALEGEETLEDIIARAQTDQGRDPGARLLAFQSTGDGNGALAFDRLRVDFTKEGDVVTIREANLRGQMLGGTADGVLDLSTGEVRLNGTLIPAYGVNNLFGRVPLVGEILGGGNQGGLIGVTFRVSGPAKSPSFTVNPLSAVAPGIFRRIFEFR